MRSMVAHAALISDACQLYKVKYTPPGADGLHCYEIFDSRFDGLSHVAAIETLKEYLRRDLHLSIDLIRMWLGRSKIYFGDKTKVTPW